MNKEFVTFELAKKLKEKGFLEKCVASFSPDYGIFEFNKIDPHGITDSYELNVNIKGFKRCYNYCECNNFDAPTISQALKWLREKKEIMVSPIYSTNTSKWYCVVVNADSLEQYKLSLFDSYELAVLEGIEYVLDNII